MSNDRTIRLHRVLKAPPDRVYRAFLDPDAMARWSPPHGFLGKVHEQDARVGHGYKMSFINFSTGTAHSFSGTYRVLEPNRRIEYTDRFDAPGPQDEMTVAVSLRGVSCGTELTIEQSNLPASIPLEMCYLGWQESLAQLANLVEPEIPDGM